MERITYRDKDGTVKVLPMSEWRHKNGLFYAKDIDPYDCRPYLERLAEYEDTGLTPEQITPKRGRWEMLSYDEAICTCCGYDRNTPFDSTREAKERWSELPPYCEMCGAFLKEETNGKTDDPKF